MAVSKRRLAFATTEEFAGLDDGWPYLSEALMSVGLSPSVVFWDDRDVKWETYDLVVTMFAWGYVTRRTEFLSWAEDVAESVRLMNPLPVLRWNSDKRYLVELAADGVPIVPTQWVHPGDAWYHPSEDFVIKPSVGSGGFGAARFRTQSADTADDHVRRLHDQGTHTVLVQPYQPAIDTGGETALIFLGGRYSHTINKAALLQPDVGTTDRLWEQEVIKPVEPRENQREVAERVLRAVDRRFGSTAYGRVDLVDGVDDTPLVLELELVEPNLFFAHAKDAAALFAAHLRTLTPG